MTTKQEKQEKAAADAYAITERMNEARLVESSSWPHQAQAVIDIREVKGWKALGLASFSEWCAQLDVPIGVSKAKKLAATLSAFTDAGFDDFEMLGACNYSNLAITAAFVRNPDCELDAETAVGDVLVLRRPDLEAKLDDLASGKSQRLDADAEPDKWRCPHCFTVKARMPKHLEESSDDHDGEVGF